MTIFYSNNTSSNHLNKERRYSMMPIWAIGAVIIEIFKYRKYYNRSVAIKRATHAIPSGKWWHRREGVY